MKRDIVTKVVIQVVACGLGLFGLFFVYLAVYSVVAGLRDSDWLMMIPAVLLYAVLGGFMIAVAWRALRGFGPDTITSVVALVLFFACSQLTWFLESSQHNEPHRRSGLLEAALDLGPLCLAFLFHGVISRKLIQMTGTATSDDRPHPCVDPQERNSTSANE